MRVLVTGGTGFTGRCLVRQLHALGHKVAIVSRSKPVNLPIEIDAIRGDLMDITGINDSVHEFAPEAFVHAAWQGITGTDRYDVAQFNNIAPALQLVNMAMQAGAQTVMVLGSQAEYGRSQQMLHEASPTHPETYYGMAKHALHQALRPLCQHTGVRLIWPRLFSVYGADDHPQRLIPILARHFAQNEAPSLTACEQQWDFLHVEDAARALAALLLCPQAEGVFNVASGQMVRLRDAVMMLRNAFKATIEPGFGDVPYRDDQVMRMEADISKLEKQTGWSPLMSLEQGMAKVATDWRAT